MKLIEGVLGFFKGLVFRSGNMTKQSSAPKQADPAGKPWNFSEPKPKAVKKAKGKVVPLTAEQILARSQPSGRKPNRAQRRALTKSQ